MYFKFWQGVAPLGAFLVIGMMPSANAETAAAPADTGATGLTEIVVTARRTRERAQDVPQSVIGIGAATLQNLTVQNFNDLQYVAPGLNLVGGYTGGYINPSIRGQYQSTNAQGTQPGVATYFAEVYAPTQPAQLYDLADIQVLKGPQGTLFGRNSTGGAVLIGPERPNTSSLSGYVKGELGNLKYGDIEGAVNIPVIDGKLAIRVAGDHESRDGYTRNLYNGTTLDGSNFTGSRVSILFTPIDGVENYTVYTASHYHTEPSNVLYAVLCGRIPTAPACFYNSPFISPQFGGLT
jgi:iron complex outermembrane receptor protein